MKQIALTMTCAMMAMASFATTYYAKPNGTGNGLSYANAGEFSTLVKKLSAGDILYCLGGQYNYSSNVKFSCSGTADKMISIFAYPGVPQCFD